MLQPMKPPGQGCGSTFWIALCVCVLGAGGGCYIWFSYFTHSPGEQSRQGEVRQPISESPNKAHFPERDQPLYPFPISKALFVTEMSNCKCHHRRASIYSMSDTDHSLGTRQYWNSSAESKEQMFCSFQEETPPATTQSFKIAVNKLKKYTKEII